MSADRSEHSALRHRRCRHPPVNRTLYPNRHSNRADVIAFAHQIDGPVPLPFRRLASSARRSPHPSSIEIIATPRTLRRLPPFDFSELTELDGYSASFRTWNPLLDPFDSPDARGELRTQQA